MPYTTVAQVVIAAKNLEIHAGKTATITESEFNQMIGEADAIIDSTLSPTVYTPLRQITRNSVTKYPDPIPFIAARIAAALGVRSAYSRIDPQVSENANAHLEDAMRQLRELASRSRLLDGQSYKHSNFFVNPYVAPLNPPGNTTGTV